MEEKRRRRKELMGVCERVKGIGRKEEIKDK